jgi:hypothetical protein
MSVSSSKDEDGVVARGTVTASLRWHPELLLCSCRQRTDASIIRFRTSGEKGQAEPITLS